MEARNDCELEAVEFGTLSLFEPAAQDRSAAEARRSSQQETVLALLRDRGQTGITNGELNEICFRYGARIFELRGLGHAIETIAEGNGVFRFILTSSPVSARPQAAGEKQGPQVKHGTRRKSASGPQAQKQRAIRERTGTETEVQQPEKGMGRYDHLRLDFAHALVTQKKFVEYKFHVTGSGEVACPACGASMARAEKQEHLATHFVCMKSGLVFFGDAEGISLCLHPVEDVTVRP